MTIAANNTEIGNSETTELIARLLPIATRFRSTLEHIQLNWEQVVEDADDRPSKISVFGMLKHFPLGCCDKTTFLLTRYLHEQGFSNVRSVYGNLTTGKFGAHEWNEVENVIVDITADQFKRVRPRPQSIIVTNNRAFHNRYSIRGEFHYSPGWTEWGWYDDCIDAAEWMYSTVVRLISSEPI